MFFFFNDTATTEIYTLSLHDALPISGKYRARERSLKRSSRRVREHTLYSGSVQLDSDRLRVAGGPAERHFAGLVDRKSTRLNSSHANISYAVFCLKKKKKYTGINYYL